MYDHWNKSSNLSVDTCFFPVWIEPSAIMEIYLSPLFSPQITFKNGMDLICRRCPYYCALGGLLVNFFNYLNRFSTAFSTTKPYPYIFS